MMKYVYALLVSLVLSACLATPSRYDLSVAEYNRTAQIAVVCKNGEGFGTGVIVAPDYVLTAQHVVDGCKDETGASGLIVVTSFGTEYDGLAEVIVEDDETDIARLYVPGIRGPSVVIGPPPHAGDEVCFTPSFPDRNRSCGYVQHEKGEVGTEIRFTGLVQPGNSGSGLYDSQGRLVGLVTILTRCANGQWCGGGATLISGQPKGNPVLGVPLY